MLSEADVTSNLGRPDAAAGLLPGRSVLLPGPDL